MKKILLGIVVFLLILFAVFLYIDNIFTLSLKSSIGIDSARLKLANFYYNSSNAKAFNLLLRLDLNDPEVEYKIAQCYKQGLGVEKNTNEYLKHLKIAAEKGYSLAQIELGKYYIDSEEDEKSASYWFEKAYNSANKDAIIPLANIYMGRVVNNPKKAFDLFTEAMNNGDIEGKFAIARFYAEGSKALSLLKECAEENHAESQYRLAQYYENKKEMENAIFWYKKSAELGNKSAIREMAQFYEKGENGLPKDIQKAKEYYEILAKTEKYFYSELAHIYEAENDLKKAVEYYMLSNQYVGLHGIKGEYELIASSLRKLGESGDKDAYYVLCEMFKAHPERYGIKGEIYDEMHLILEKLSKEDYSSAMRLLSECYLDGIGCKKSNDRAIKYLTQAIMLGDESAAGNLLNMWDSGKYEIDPLIVEKAAKFLTLRNDHYFGSGPKTLAKLYRTGAKGIPQDYKKSLFYDAISIERSNIPYDGENDFGGRQKSPLIVLAKKEKNLITTNINEALKWGDYDGENLGIKFYTAYWKWRKGKENQHITLVKMKELAQSSSPDAIRVFLFFDYEHNIQYNLSLLKELAQMGDLKIKYLLEKEKVKNWKEYSKIFDKYVVTIPYETLYRHNFVNYNGLKYISKKDYADAVFEYSQEISYDARFKELNAAAMLGSAKAQYKLATYYESGHYNDILKDLIKAYAWASIAASKSYNNEISIFRDYIAEQLTASELEKAKYLAALYKKAIEGDGVLSDKEHATSVISGTGFAISNNGFIVTNNHVIKDAKSIYVYYNGNKYNAVIVANDSQNDISILKIPAQTTGLPIVYSKNVKVGEDVFTLGFPNTAMQGYEPKFTTGNISSLKGVMDSSNMFQISIPLQPGNSGGAMVNSYGEVVGIITAKIKQDEVIKTTGTIAENVNYAVKSSYLLNLLESNSEIEILSPTEKRNKMTSSEIAEYLKKSTVRIVVQ